MWEPVYTKKSSKIICPHKCEVEATFDTKDKKLQIVKMRAPYCRKHKQVVEIAQKMCENCSGGVFKS